MKWLFWGLLVISPSAMSVTGDYEPISGVIAPVLLAGIALPLAGRPSGRSLAVSSALAGLVGATLGFVVGGVVALGSHYWWGLVSSAAMLVAALAVLWRCRTVAPDQPLMPGL